jgi:hypothetical protein
MPNGPPAEGLLRGVAFPPQAGGGGSAPVVSNATMRYRADTGTGGSGTTTPTGTGNAIQQQIGVAKATNSPTSWSITAGNSSGFFAIDNSGNVTVTATGASGLTNTGSFSLTIQATNGSGSGTGTLTIVNWPNASNTGYRTSLTAAPSNTISAGGTYSSLSYTGAISITTTAQVNFVDCLFTDTSTTSVATIIVSGAENVAVSHCTLIGAGSSSTKIPQYGIWAQTGFSGVLSVDSCDISLYGQNITYGSGTITYTNNYAHDWHSGSGTHYEIIYNGGSGGPPTQTTIEFNSFLNQQNQTAVIFNENEFGPLDNMLINDNLLVGGDFTIYVNGAAGTYPIGATNNFIITNNFMGYTPGEFGYFDLTPGTASVYNVTHTGNVDYITGVSVD